MMKRLILITALLAVVTSGAYAYNVSIVAIQGTAGGATNARAMSNDGRYVGGSNNDPTGAGFFPIYWDAQTQTATNRYLARGTGYLTGIDWESSGKVGLGGWGGNVGRGGNSVPMALAMGTLRDHTNATSAGEPGAYNSVAATSDGADAWLAGTRQATKGNEGYLWKTNNTSVMMPTRTITGGGGRLLLESCAAVGVNARAVGHDSGFGGSDRAVWADTAGNAQAIPLVPNGPGRGMGFGISPDGEKFSGYMYPDPAITLKVQGFIWTRGDANAVMLKPAGGDAEIANEQSVAYDVTADGMAVGYTWRNDTSNDGCIWLPGDLVAKRLLDWLPTKGVNVTGWSDLSTAVSIASLGSGWYAITGDGTYNGGARGYYILVPEPGTMAFLVLGGLALLRRR